MITNHDWRLRADLIATARKVGMDESFTEWLMDNSAIYLEFERQALAVGLRRTHYSARTIMEFIRHDSLLREVGSGWKINNNIVPGCARLFAARHPKYARLFSYREREAA